MGNTLDTPAAVVGPATPRRVVADFNETLVQERTLPAWCRHQMRHGSPPSRLAAALWCLPIGAVAMAIDGLGLEVHAARLGFLAFRGTRPELLAAWGARHLTPNPAALAELARIAQTGPIQLTVVSRGTPALVVRAWLSGPAGASLTPLLGERAPTLFAPELDERFGRLTGRVRSGLEGKPARLLRVGDDGLYLGDRRDRWARSLGERFRAV